MNCVDSCGWLEYFADGKKASFYAKAIQDVESLVVPTMVLLEVFKRIAQQRDEATALQAAAAMQQGRVVDLDAGIALAAAALGLRHGLPLADSVILATARAADAVVWTQDAHFRDLPGVRFCA
ncbi:MAG: type II toxin-antitoxin system VapC family toxin [Acidobacteria bacterium]|nr:type II toxin-antitoxin system VapC family toxin [Acidobacteriota bacterium]